MKVRHKRTGDVLDLDALLGPLINEHYEIIADAPSEPRWQDVTGECDVGWDGIKLRYPDGRENELPPNYRLRKVQINEGLVRERPEWAFLIERKVE